MIDFDATVLAAAQDAFGERVLWLPSDYPSQSVTSIFYGATQETKFRDGVEVTEVVTLLSVRVGGFARLPQSGDLFQVRGRLYVATEVTPDGVGAARVRLRFASDQEAARAPLPAAA